MASQLNLKSPHLYSPLLDTHTLTHTKIACNNNNPTDDSFSPHHTILTSPPPPPSPPHTIKQSLTLTLRMTNPSIFPSFFFFLLHHSIYACSSLSANPTTPRSNTLHSSDRPTAYSAALTPPIYPALVCRFSHLSLFLCPSLFPPLSLSLSLLSLCLSLSPRSWLVLVKYQGKRIPAFFSGSEGLFCAIWPWGAFQRFRCERHRERRQWRERKRKCVFVRVWETDR